MTPFQITQAQLRAFQGEPIAKCPLNWIDLEYLYVDGSPVAGAKYTVNDAHSGFCTTGTLDERGQSHVELPPNVSQVTYSFHDDPDIIQIEKQPQPHGQKVTPGWMDRARQMLVDSGSWVWGVIQGDFNEDASIGQIITNTLITMIPVVDQAADIRDLTANLKVIIWDEEYDNYEAWVALTLTLFGIIPVLGSLLKGVCKAIWLGARKVSLNDLLKVFNFFAKGNGYKWLKKLESSKLDEIGEKCIQKLHELLAAVSANLKSLSGYIPGFFSSTHARIALTISSIKKVQAKAGEMIRKVVGDLKAKLKEILQQGGRREQPGTTRQKNTEQQQAKNAEDLRKARLEKLAADPAQGGKITAKTMREAEIAADLEDAGKLKSPVIREPTGKAEFIDGDGTKWDVKAFNSSFPPRKGGFSLERDMGKIQSELAQNENVILDTKDLSSQHLQELMGAVNKLEPGLKSRILWYP